MKRYLKKSAVFLCYCFLTVALSSAFCAGNMDREFESLSKKIEEKNMEPAGGTGGKNPGGSTSCPKEFDSYTNDAQLDAYCGYAWMYRCKQGKSLNDPAVKAVCTYYNEMKTSSAPSCPYCK